MALEDMSIQEFIDSALEYNKENNIELDIKNGTDCPVHHFAGMKNKSCKQVLGGTKNCPLCGFPMCPICSSHSVTQISRVTGYISTVSDRVGQGWNAAKKQELLDRKRIDFS